MGNMTGSACLRMTVTTMNKMTMVNTTMRRMGRGCVLGKWTTGGNPTMTLMTRRAEVVNCWPPLPPLSTTTIAATAGGGHCDPPIRSITSCQTLLVVIDVANHG
jgi:hypothetical protein